MSILFAATYPERVSALILAAGAARWPAAPDYPCGRESEEMMAAIEDIASHRWGQGESLSWFVPPRVAESPGARQRFARWERMSVSPSALLRIVRMIHQVDVRDVLPAIHVPALVIQRLDDRITAPCHGRYLADHLPRARYFEQPGCHLPWLDDSDAMLAEIEQFLVESGGHAPELDRVLVTLVYALTDNQLEGARGQVQAHKGRLISCTNESTLATFDSPVRAIRYAVAMRDDAAAAGTAVRAAVHVGEVEFAGGDIAGASREVAAAVAVAARPGEILATRIVTDLVLGSGIAFDARGERELPGLHGEWPLFSAVSHSRRRDA